MFCFLLFEALVEDSPVKWVTSWNTGFVVIIMIIIVIIIIIIVIIKAVNQTLAIKRNFICEISTDTPCGNSVFH